MESFSGGYWNGNGGDLDGRGKEACKKAQALIGAKRMLKQPISGGSRMLQPEEIVNYIKEHPEYENLSRAFVRGCGTYSGASRLLKRLEDRASDRGQGHSRHFFRGVFLRETRRILGGCGTKKPAWRQDNITAAVREHEKTVILAGSAQSVRSLCRKLAEYGYGSHEGLRRRRSFPMTPRRS